VNKNDRIDLDDRFEALEKRIEELETIVAKLTKTNADTKYPLSDIPKFEWRNGLGIATVYDIYKGKASG